MLLLNKNRLMTFHKIIIACFICMLYAMELLKCYNVIIILVIAILSLSYSILNIANECSIFKSYKIDLLILFGIIVVLSMTVNFKYGITDNLLSLFIIFLDYIIFYSIGSKKNELQVKELFSFSTHLVIFFQTALSVFSFLMYSMQLSNVMYIEDSMIRQGFMEGRLFGIFGDPNYSAVISLIVLILCVYYFVKNKDKLHRALYCIAIFANICYMILSGSRTALLSAIISIFIGGYFWTLKKLINKNNKFIKQAICVFSAIFITLISLSAFELTRFGLSFIPSAVSYVQNPNITKEMRQLSLAREDVQDTEDYSNNRINIWSSALTIFKQKPLLGTSTRNMVSFAQSEMPATYIATSKYMIHNSFLEVLVFNGLIGFSVMALFICFCAYHTFKHLFTNINDHFPEVLLGTMIIVSLMTSGLTLSGLFYNRGEWNMLFWLTLGYLTFFTCPKEESISFKLLNRIFKQGKSRL